MFPFSVDKNRGKIAYYIISVWCCVLFFVSVVDAQREFAIYSGEHSKRKEKRLIGHLFYFCTAENHNSHIQ